MRNALTSIACDAQGEKLSSTIVFTFLQLAAGLVLGVHIPADIAQLAVFLPNSRCCWDS